MEHVTTKILEECFEILEEGFCEEIRSTTKQKCGTKYTMEEIGKHISNIKPNQDTIPGDIKGIGIIVSSI